MERRLLSAVVILWGLTAAGYLMWCQHRISMPVLMHDAAWPRPFPYPDEWLSSWYDRIDAANPPPSGGIKMCGEWYHLQGRVRAWTVTALAIAAFGVAILVWAPSDRGRSRWPSVRRGVAIGLVVGLAWASVLGHAGREGLGSFGNSLTVWGVGFVVAGAVVGTVRHYPELVGACTGSVAVAALSSGVPGYDRSDFLGWDQRAATEFLAALMIVDDYGAALILLVGYALFWGLVIGAIHRLFRHEPSAPGLPSPLSPYLID